jgi:hypothetical protein
MYYIPQNVTNSFAGFPLVFLTKPICYKNITVLISYKGTPRYAFVILSFLASWSCYIPQTGEDLNFTTIYLP